MDWVRLSSIEFYNRTKSNSTKRKKYRSNPNERSIFELVICVKQASKIHNQVLEAQVTWARSVAFLFFVNEEIPQKRLQMRCAVHCKIVKGTPVWCQGWRSFQGFKENRRERPCTPNCKRAWTIWSPSTWTGCFPVFPSITWYVKRCL